MKKAIDIPKMQSVLNAASLKLANTYKDLLVYNIENNTFNNKNSSSTISSKKSNVPMIDSKELLGKIIVENFTVKMQAGNHYSGLSYEELMTILEYGRIDKHILPMRVWRKTRDQFIPKAKEIIEKEFKKSY